MGWAVIMKNNEGSIIIKNKYNKNLVPGSKIEMLTGGHMELNMLKMVQWKLISIFEPSLFLFYFGSTQPWKKYQCLLKFKKKFHKCKRLNGKSVIETFAQVLTTPCLDFSVRKRFKIEKIKYKYL